MRFLKLWTCVVHFTLLCLVSDRVGAAPALTTIQDTLYKADGTRFNGVAYIEWNSFQASDASAIATSSVVVSIVDGVLRVRLVPTSNASAGAHYVVRYHSDGKVQFTEKWNVVPSATPVTLAAIRVANGALTGGTTTPPAALAITDIVGLSDELAARPVKGFGYTVDRIVKSGPTGALESVQGNLADCIHVDGTTGSCGSGSSGDGGPGFVDQEVPSGTINGSNTVFTLTQAPSPAASLQLYRNGVLFKPGVDYTLTGGTIVFGSLSVPQTGDLILASYRLSSGSSPSGTASGALTGSFPAPQIAENVISNYNIGAAAGIMESKLALQYPTHSNANDPAANEKAALSGTAGSPSATNKYVTDVDLRLSNARAPQGHPLLGAEHSDTTTAPAQRGDLIAGSFATGVAKWARLPLGGTNRCLTSNGVDAIWNTCLFTGFHASAVPFTGSEGTMAESPMYFTWDNSNRRLSIGSNLNASTLTVYDSAVNGSTTVTVRGGLSQGQNVLQTWQNSSGIERASIGADGVMAVETVEAVSSVNRAAWREAGTPSDPAVRTDGDVWYNSSEQVRKSSESGQIHAIPQVICAANGGTSNSTIIMSFGTCSIPGGLLLPGDRLAIRATWSHNGTAGYIVRWRWGGATVGSLSVPGNAALLDQKGEVVLYNGGAILDGAAKGSTGFPFGTFVENSTQEFANGLTLAFEGNTTDPGESLRLIQFTVIRFPAQSNP
ncbi:MAG: hypothetical protein ACKV2U_04155 [Bryobacteraceae bacterium]